MSTISKDTAKKMAEMITAKHRAAANKIFNDFKETLLSEYRATIPKQVRDCFAKNREYFRTTSQIGVKLDGNYHRYFPVVEPVLCNDGTNASLETEPAMIEHLVKLNNEYVTAEKEYKKLLSEVEAALITLKTAKRIAEQFPEAKEFLPEPPSHAIVVNLDKIRKEISTAK